MQGWRREEDKREELRISSLVFSLSPGQGRFAEVDVNKNNQELSSLLCRLILRCWLFRFLMGNRCPAQVRMVPAGLGLQGTNYKAGGQGQGPTTADAGRGRA